MNPKTDPFYRLLERTTSRFALLADGDDGQNGGGGGNGSGDGSGGGNNDALARFASALESINNSNAATTGKFDELIGLVRGAQDASGGEPSESQVTVEDLEGMSRADLVAYIAGTMQRSFDERLRDALQPIVNALGQQQNTVATDQVTRQIDALKNGDGRYPAAKDFDDWKGDMAELSKVHTTLNIRQLYNLARAENPTKAADLDKKYAPPPEPTKPRWGGLTPTGTSLTAEAIKAAGPTTGKEATAAALSEVAERHPVLAGLLNS